jgi:thiol-disulfide isomerase/thioredoxin
MERIKTNKNDTLFTMKRPSVIFFFLLLFILDCSAQSNKSWYTVKAFLPQWNDALVTIDKEGGHLGSGPVVNDMFSFTGSCTEACAATIRLRKNGKNLVIPFFIEPGTIRLRAKSEFNIYVYGTPLNDSYTKFYHDADSISFLSQVTDAQETKRHLAGTFITAHPQSLLSLRLLNELYYLNPKANDSVYYALYNILDDSLKYSSAGIQIGEEVKTRYATSAGRTAPLVQLRDIAGKPAMIYRPGSITLIHFWASWCLPCRIELTDLKKTIAKFKDRKPEIVMVSLDKDSLQWKRSVDQVDVTWLQLIDTGAWEGLSAKSYGVKTLPANFLLNENGQVIGRHLSVNDIDVLLNHYFR